MESTSIPTTDPTGKIVEVWLPDGRSIIGRLLRHNYSAKAYLIECEGEDGSVTDWAVPEAQIIAIGCNRGQ